VKQLGIDQLGDDKILQHRAILITNVISIFFQMIFIVFIGSTFWMTFSDASSIKYFEMVVQIFEEKGKGSSLH